MNICRCIPEFIIFSKRYSTCSWADFRASRNPSFDLHKCVGKTWLICVTYGWVMTHMWKPEIHATSSSICCQSVPPHTQFHANSLPRTYMPQAAAFVGKYKSCLIGDKQQLVWEGHDSWVSRVSWVMTHMWKYDIHVYVCVFAYTTTTYPCVCVCVYTTTTYSHTPTHTHTLSHTS